MWVSGRASRRAYKDWLGRTTFAATAKTYKHASAYKVAMLDQNLRVATGTDRDLRPSRRCLMHVNSIRLCWRSLCSSGTTPIFSTQDWDSVSTKVLTEFTIETSDDPDCAWSPLGYHWGLSHRLQLLQRRA